MKLTKFVSYTMNIGFLLNEVLNLWFSRKIHISKNENVFCPYSFENLSCVCKVNLTKISKRKWFSRQNYFHAKYKKPIEGFLIRETVATKTRESWGLKFLKFVLRVSLVWDYSFSTFAKLSEKLTFLFPWYAHVHVCIRG